MSAQITSFTLFVSPPSLCSCLCGFADFLRAFFLCPRLPYFFPFPLLLCRPLHPSILCPRHYRGSWLNCLKTWQQAARISGCVCGGQTSIYCFYSCEGSLVIGSSPSDGIFLPLVSFSAAQHKRTLLREAEQDAKKKKLGNVMSLGHMFTLVLI